ncbi:pseudouridine-5'-phosphate glycosidase [Aureimonas leprariae]|uniref:Pseudouridine-5'-phosphate glycosidase n=1 Tax=Plantimonas leprariae TaxID=2615207 RepID=A0A7V7PR02_9HYPH|nr:pseudouridine-5'-phosphate glycosidase [Aureimonas leprariae]KAB0680855.1 pseudouridine-5'-phosphate glycosidase [Aureimonas leprariae]
MSGERFTPSNAVASALADGRAVVALESTIITHGMPFPQNVETAVAVEEIVRSEGAVPATIAVLDGTLRVGLEANELDRLAQAKNVMKLSRADLAYAVAAGRTGSTTVAATMIAAYLAGVRVFATGGIGGVHRGAETSFDISADLEELAQTPVIVVSAGAKAILDLRKTMEVLETKGVPVVGYGTDEFPAFWSRRSGLPAPLRLDSAEAIAAFQRARQRMGIDGGMLIGNPLDEASEIPAETIGAWIGQALADAEAGGVSGKAVTPFLLQRIFELSDGRSLEANIALVKSNARLAARIAVALAQGDMREALSAR